MKRLTLRYKKWLMHRQRYASRQRRAAAARLSHAPSTQRIVQLYATVQKLARQLAYRDAFYVIWAYSQYLQTQGFHIPNDIEVATQFKTAVPPQALLAEWTLEQIAREVIQYANETSQGGRSLRQWATLAQIANALRDLEGEIYARLVGGKKIHLELMRISHRQFIWQQQSLNWRWIIRYYKLFNTPPIDALSQKTTGLTIDHIHLIGMSYLGMFLKSPFAMRQIKVEIPGLTEGHIDRFLRFTSLDLADLRKRLRAEHALDEGFVYRYSSLREFPLIRISQGASAEIACPIPTLLFWRVTTGLYYALKDEKGFPTALGQSFQDYVGEVLRHRITNKAMRVLGEAEYQVGRHRKDTVDWILQQGDEVALFVECKTKRLTWASKAGLADLTALEQDIRKLAGAVIQVYRTIIDYRANRYTQLPFSAGRRIYPVIVTLEDWYFFGHELPVRLETAVKEVMIRADLPIDWLEEMPYSVMSVDEFETATGVINTIGIHPFISGKVLDPQRRHWSYGPYGNDRYPNEVRNLPPLFEGEYEAMFAGLVP
ncbi:MAG: hypothetical protein ABSG18_23115 [Steroidobacteraceae bacterium]|jgi:hypothetical protein